MEVSDKLFEVYKGMVYSYTHTIAEEHHVDFEELIGHGLEIFCKAAGKFDPERKVAFSTYLHWQLQDLRNRAVKEYKTSRDYFSGIGFEDSDSMLNFNEGFFESVLSTIDFSEEKYNLLYDIVKQLSNESQQYLTDLFAGVFQRPKNPKGGAPEKFPISRICDYYGWSNKQALFVKNEITEWWSEYRMVS